MNIVIDVNGVPVGIEGYVYRRDLPHIIDDDSWTIICVWRENDQHRYRVPVTLEIPDQDPVIKVSLEEIREILSGDEKPVDRNDQVAEPLREIVNGISEGVK